MDEIEQNDEDPPQFGSTEYWDERYTNNTATYEWFLNWTHFDSIINDLLNQKTFEKVLNLGCGSSPLSENIREHFNEIYNIDISSVVIDQMKKTYEQDSKQKWIAMDCLNLDLENSVFDAVFDKGTLDAILCGQDAQKKLMTCLIEIFRVLKTNGYFISVTCGLFVPEIAPNCHFKGKKLNIELVYSQKMSNPESEDQIIFFHIIKKLGDGYGESGCDDFDVIFKDETDHLMKILGIETE